MSSIIEGCNYDIFISYRQKDNKHDGWVTEFVDNLKGELESTFKEEISVYFDINPHDGLLETHDVGASLKDKLKCLLFIPIISRTYCDPKSFAWEHEFKAFVEQASQDQFGLKVKLTNGNVASRVLPVRIYDLDNNDIKLCESVLEGVLRGVEFIYAELGVNRPLKPDDDEKINLNKTKYRNQINKLGNAVKEIFSGLKIGPSETDYAQGDVISIKEQIALKDKSIIVLPFENLSPDPDQEYFSDGLTEEIITELSHIDDFLVISRSSAMTFKGTNRTLPEIAMMVNVRYVLEGSVRKSGNNLRITAQFIDALTDRHLWAEKYSGTLDDIFDIQESVSRKIVLALKGRFSQKDQQKLLSPPYTQNIGVYEVYSRAHYEFWKYESGNLDRALQILEEAIKIFGEHPLLLSGLGAVHWQLYHYRGDLKETHLIRIKECSDRLLSIDNRSAPGNRLKSYIALHNGDVDDAIRYLKKALDIDPGDTETLLWLSYLLIFHAGRPAEAQPVVECWKAIDPLHPLSGITLALLNWMNGDLEVALRVLEKWHKQEPDDPIYSFYLGHIYAWMGNFDKALQIAEEMFLKNPGEFMGQTLRFLTLAINGKVEEAKDAVSSVMREMAWMDFHLPWLMTEGYSILGEINEALVWFERTVDKGFFNYPLFNELDPLLANIRNQPRFIKIMERVKQKWKDFEF